MATQDIRISRDEVVYGDSRDTQPQAKKFGIPAEAGDVEAGQSSSPSNSKTYIQPQAKIFGIPIEAGDVEAGQSSSPSNSKTYIQPQEITAAGESGNNRKGLEKDPIPLWKMSVDANSWSIYKVPYPLCEVNKKSYEPNVISIGPYHRGKERLKTMEVIKRNCFSRMINESKTEAQEFVAAMKDIENKVRECYEQPIDGMAVDPDTFVEMMVLDGCFIVLLFQKDSDLHKTLGKMCDGTLTEIYRDLLLLENQLPFFVLSKLCDMMKKSNEDEFPRSVVTHYSEVLLPGPEICLPKKIPKSQDINHLLGLVYSSWVPSGSGAEEKPKGTKAQSWWKFLGCGRMQKENGIDVEGQRPWKFIRCATELDEAGINFVNKCELKDKNEEKVQYKKGKTSLFDIDFIDGNLKIPALQVEDNTECIFRNFMVYEQFLKIKPAYVCDYVNLMDNLINSGKDVQLLCRRGIIDNWLGDDEAVAGMFNKFCDCIYWTPCTFYYKEIYDEVNKHCGRRRNKWKAKLKKDYFNSPWSLISVIAAIVLLLLTIAQSVFSVLSYVHPK